MTDLELKWNAATMQTDNIWRSVTWLDNASYFVAVTDTTPSILLVDQKGGRVVTDGIPLRCFAVASSDKIVVGIGNEKSSDGSEVASNFMVSSDLQTWSRGSFPFDTTGFSICWAEGPAAFVVIGDRVLLSYLDTNNEIAFGVIHWFTDFTCDGGCCYSPEKNCFVAIATTAGKIVKFDIVGNSVSDIFMYDITPKNARSVHWNGNMFIVPCFDGTILNSIDGMKWEVATGLKNFWWAGASATKPGLSVIVGWSDSQTSNLSIYYGSKWSIVTNPQIKGQFNSIARTNASDVFCVVGFPQSQYGILSIDSVGISPPTVTPPVRSAKAADLLIIAFIIFGIVAVITAIIIVIMYIK